MNGSDIKFYHSGGGGNCSAEGDLGGARSTCVLSAGGGNLFENLSATQSRDGLTDYRCFYIKNTHADETLRNAKLYISSQHAGGSTIWLGVPVEDTVINVVITGSQSPLEGEYMVMGTTGYDNAQIYYHPNITIWQGRFQTVLRSINGLKDVRVSVAGSVGFPTSVTFTITFAGSAGSRELNMTNVSDTLTGQTINIARPTAGKPINTVADVIATKTTAPVVDFEIPSRGNPVNLGDLLPDDELPVWVRRVTPEGSLAKINDSFSINIDGAFP